MRNNMNKRFLSSWTFGNPFSLRFQDPPEDPPEPPVLSVDLDALKGHKSEEGLNFFSDDHLEKLNIWGSDDPTKAKFRTEDGKVDVPKLTKSYLEAQARIAKMSNPLPEDATEAERFEYRKNLARILGVPESPEDYQIIPPEGVELDKDTVNQFKLTAHKHNLSKEAVQAMFELHNNVMAKGLELRNNMIKTQNNETETKMKADMGPDDFAASDQLLQRYIHRFVENEEHFDKVFEDIKTTLFPGGSATKVVLFKALCEAARVAEGEGKSIYTQYEEKMTQEQELKEEFPKQWEDLKD
jgi:hypothetical protein